VRHHYSLDQAWNADQTLLALDRNRNGCPNLLIDGKTFQVKSELPSFSYESRWHPVNPALRIYVGGHEIGYWDVLRKQNTIIATFDGYDRLSFANKGNVSDDGNKVAVFGHHADGRAVMFAYDIARRTKYPDISPVRPVPDKFAPFQECTISPSGKYIVYNNGDDTRTVYDLEGKVIFSTEKANPTHCDLGYDQAGQEVIVGRSNFKKYSGRLIMRRLSDGFLTVLNGPNGEKLGCGHVSMRNIRRPGWAYCSGVFYPPYSGWIIAVKLDDSRTVEKFCQVFNQWKDYPTETHASPSWDGKKVIMCVVPERMPYRHQVSIWKIGICARKQLNLRRKQFCIGSVNASNSLLKSLRGRGCR
jgi:hypothetical protein